MTAAAARLAEATSPSVPMTTVAELPPASTSTGLVRVIEVWAVDGETIALESAVYRDAPTIGAVAQTTLILGEGLPGRVLATGAPVVFSDLGAEQFRRREAAARDRLAAGVGFPVYRDGAIAAVVLLLLAETAEGVVGAIESWEPDAERNELRLGTSHYAGLERFEMISRYVQFPYGSGLPGEIKVSGEPRLLTGLGRSKEFIRASGAEADGLSVALAWPVIAYGDDLKAVLILLSAASSPLARVFQIWTEVDGQLQPQKMVSKDFRSLAEATARGPVRKGVGLIGRVWETLHPLATSDFAGESDEVRRLIADGGLQGAVAIPVLRGETLQGIIALWG